MHLSPYERWPFIAVIIAVIIAVATLTFSCHPRGDVPGVPLYPNGATMRLPRDQIAQVVGPLAKVDGQDVLSQGGGFDLLPGCHIVELDRRMATDYPASGVYLSGQFPRTIYALRLKAGARYVIRRQLFSEGQTGVRVVLSAREEDDTGAAADLVPAKSAEDFKACKDWETTARPTEANPR